MGIVKDPVWHFKYWWNKKLFEYNKSSLDILVNNAGAVWTEPLEDFSEQGWDKVMDLNVKSIFLWYKNFYPC